MINSYHLLTIHKLVHFLDYIVLSLSVNYLSIEIISKNSQYNIRIDLISYYIMEQRIYTILNDHIYTFDIDKYFSLQHHTLGIV